MNTFPLIRSGLLLVGTAVEILADIFPIFSKFPLHNGKRSAHVDIEKNSHRADQTSFSHETRHSHLRTVMYRVNLVENYIEV